MGQRRQRLEAQGRVEGCHVHDCPVAGLQVWPRRSGEIEDQVDLFSSVAVPLLVGDVLEPVEVRHRRVVEQHVEMTEGLDGVLNECSAVCGRHAINAQATRRQISRRLPRWVTAGW